MGKTRQADNSKKAAGQARKKDAAEQKRADEEARAAAAEAAKWDEGSKGKSKKDSVAEKQAEQARKKAEREAQLQAEEAELPTKGSAQKKKGQNKAGNRAPRGIDDALKASGIEDAIDALDIATGKQGNGKDIERHPERRFKAAYLAYEERRLPEYKEEHRGLRLNQYKELIRKEFEKSPENPFNQTTVDYNATRDDVAGVRSSTKGATESRLMNNR